MTDNIKEFRSLTGDELDHEFSRRAQVVKFSNEPPPMSLEEKEDELRRLAQLTDLEYQHQRGRAKIQLGIGFGALDRLVEARRQTARPEVALDRLPALEAVEGPALVDDLVADLTRHVSLDPQYAVAVAFWVIHTYALDHAFITPRLAVTAPEPRCGKTTLIDWLSGVVQRPMKSDNITAASAFHVIDEKRPTLLIDEADTFLANRDELRGILNSGHRQNGYVFRYDPKLKKSISYSTFSACAISMIGDLPATLQDRSIRIRLRRARPDERIVSLRADRVDDGLARRCARWACDSLEGLANSEPAIPEQLFNRVEDNWRPLLAIADVVGGVWPDRLRKIAVAIVGIDAGDDMTPGTRLLTEIREIFGSRDWVSSKDLASGLMMTQKMLATRLKPYEIIPRQERRSTGPVRGYRVEWFADAFSRYLAVPDVPDVPAAEPAEGEHSPSSGGSGTSGTTGTRR